VSDLFSSRLSPGFNRIISRFKPATSSARSAEPFPCNVCVPWGTESDRLKQSTLKCDGKSERNFQSLPVDSGWH
jgi:hypothetical protein